MDCSRDHRYLISTTTGELGCDEYVDDITVQWHLQLDNNEKRIDFRFIDFDIADDVVSVYDGINTENALLGSFSGGMVPEPLISSSNALLIIFESNSANEGPGFSAMWEMYNTGTSPCYSSMDEQLTGPQGRFGCNGYGNSIASGWRIIGDEGERIVLTFSTFETEPQYDMVRVYDGGSVSNTMIGEFSGYDLPPPVVGSGNELYVRFITNSDITESGFSASWTSLVESTDPCFNSTNLVLELPQGFIGCPHGYGNDLSTSWLILIRGSFKIQFDFLSFSTEESEDFVTIYDGTSASAELLGEFSGSYLPSRITSSGNSLLISFHTNDVETANGFTGTYRAIQVIDDSNNCLRSASFVVTEPQGTIGCDGYAENINEVWYINAPEDQVISLVFNSFSTEYHLDYVYVYDGNNTSAEILVQDYSGRDNELNTIISSSNSMTVRFFTQTNALAGDGFSATYSFVMPAISFTDCSSSHDYEMNDFSGAFGCDGYADSITMSWLITVDPTFAVTLSFQSFATETTYDILAVYDGEDSTAICVGAWSGKYLPPDIVSTTNQLFVEFTTNNQVEKIGFQATYNSLLRGYECSTNENKVISDSELGNIGCSGYESNIQVSWLITVSPGCYINLDFYAFDTENQHDFVRVFDGNSENSSELGEFSGNLIPPTVQSTSTEMYILFESDSNIEYSGFMAEYAEIVNNNTAIVASCEISQDYQLDAPHGTFGCDGYSNSIDSSWLISVAATQRITLQFSMLSTEMNYDYVQVYDGNSRNSTKILEVSGSVTPSSPLTSTGSSLLVTFHSDKSIEYSGFIAEYEAYGTFRESCAENVDHFLSSTYGSFGCDTYENDITVTWTIVSSPGFIILQFSRFETEQNYDTLMIYDGLDSNAPLIAVFSGSSTHSVTSTGDSMFLVFSSDATITYSGFECNYNVYEK